MAELYWVTICDQWGRRFIGGSAEDQAAAERLRESLQATLAEDFARHRPRLVPGDFPAPYRTERAPRWFAVAHAVQRRAVLLWLGFVVVLVIALFVGKALSRSSRGALYWYSAACGLMTAVCLTPLVIVSMVKRMQRLRRVPQTMSFFVIAGVMTAAIIGVVITYYVPWVIRVFE